MCKGCGDCRMLRGPPGNSVWQLGHGTHWGKGIVGWGQGRWNQRKLKLEAEPRSQDKLNLILKVIEDQRI